MKRRASLTDAGEPLVVSRSPLDLAIRVANWCDTTGQHPDTLTVTPLVSVPLPTYPTSGQTDHRWPAITSRALWHPLLWLPPHIAGRHPLPDDLQPDDALVDPSPAVLEDDEMWSVRVALELAATGLYDQASGTWLDVLARHNIDIDTPEGQGRVARWQAGSPDAVLDRIDLTRWTRFDDDPQWARDLVVAEIDRFRIIMWPVHAEALADECHGVIDQYDTDPTFAFDEALPVVTMLAGMAAASFNPFPSDGLPDDEVRLVDDEARWWAELADTAEACGDIETLIGEVVADQMLPRLTAIAHEYWPLARAFAAQDAEINPQDPITQQAGRAAR